MHKSKSLNPEFRKAAEAHTESTLSRALKNYGWVGMLMLLRKELRRFLSISGQTILSPALTTLLWFLVFGYSLGSRLDGMGGISYMNFLVPGLVMMTVIMNAFFNSGFSFFVGKIHGQIIDLLVSPLSPFQIIIAFVLAGITRGFLVGIAIWGVAIAMGADTFHHIGITLFFIIFTSMFFSLSGLITAIFAHEFEHINFIPSFLLTPLTFLGGVFYSIEMLPEPWLQVSLFNPIVYMVNGLRFGMAGVTDVSIPLSMGLLLGFNLFAFTWAFGLLRRGQFYIK